MKYPRRQTLKGIGGTLALSRLSTSAYAFQESRTATPRIRIGQIGVGHAHANKLSVYRKSPDYEVVGIVEPNMAKIICGEKESDFSPDHDLTVQTSLLKACGL
jgi:hypothetical protein